MVDLRGRGGGELVMVEGIFDACNGACIDCIFEVLANCEYNSEVQTINT